MDDNDDKNEDEAVYGISTGSTLVGVLSGPLDSSYVSDPGWSRAGGSPVWAGGQPPAALASCPGGVPACGLCKDPLYLVAQVYAPASQWPLRLLHVFGCNKSSCSGRCEAWRCYRTQSERPAWEEEEQQQQQQAVALPMPTPVPAPAVTAQPPVVAAPETSDWDFDDDDTAVTALNDKIAQLLAAHATAATAAPAPAAAAPAAPAPVMSAPAPSAPTAALPAPAWAGPQFSPQWLDLCDEALFEEATAASVAGKGAGGGSGKRGGSRSDDAKIAAMVASYLAAMGDEGDDHRDALRAELSGRRGGGGKQATGSSGSDKASSSSPSGGSGKGKKGKASGSAAAEAGSGDGDGYEATPPALLALQRFQAVVRRCPGQGVRMDWAGAPLWSSHAPPPGSSRVSSPCACGAPRLFECQLMPALLVALDVDAVALAATEAAPPAPSPPAAAAGDPGAGDNTTGAGAASGGAEGGTFDHAAAEAAGGGGGGGEGEVVDAAAARAALSKAAGLTGHGRPDARPDEACLGMDWGTVAVFSCAASCGAGGEEVVVVQPPL